MRTNSYRLDGTPAWVPAVLLLLAPLHAMLPHVLEAQGHVARPIDVRERGRGPTPSRLGRFGVMALPAPAVAPQPRFSVDVQPTFSSQAGTWQAGAGLTFNNDSLLSRIPFSVDLADQVVSADSKYHNLLQLDGSVMPPVEARLGSVPIAPTLLGTLRHEWGVGTAAEGLLEVDATLLDDTTRHTKVVISALGYLDRFDPTSGPATSGPTAGAFTEITWRALRLQGEYDVRSGFAGEDYFTIKLLMDLASKGTTFTPYLSTEKHRLLKGGLNVNLPERRRGRAGQRR